MPNSTNLAFISVLLLSASLAAAADLSGRVTLRGAPLAGAVVTADLIGATGHPASVTIARTDSHGRYVLRNLPSGNYIVLVDIEGRRVFQGRVTLGDSRFVKNIDLH